MLSFLGILTTIIFRLSPDYPTFLSIQSNTTILFLEFSHPGPPDQLQSSGCSLAPLHRFIQESPSTIILKIFFTSHLGWIIFFSLSVSSSSFVYFFVLTNTSSSCLREKSTGEAKYCGLTCLKNIYIYSIGTLHWYFSWV